MTLSQLVLRSMKKNIKHYYLYFFALIFSVTLYFSFITLQYNPSVENISGSVKVAASLKTAQYLLLFIVVFFVLYANHLFMRRRSKEIGLYQLIGMSKGLVTRLIALENVILWSGAIAIGVGVGFLTSRLFTMILLRILEKEALVSISFSIQAFQMTLFVFAILLIIVLIQTSFMIRRTSLLSLFNASKDADTRVKRFSAFQMFLGFIGLVSIVYGYYLSTKLFEGDSASVNILFIRMMLILGATIGGTFFVFRFSVAFLMNIIRKQKRGRLSIVDVLSLTPIMHRMKGNAKSLTLITVLSAIALAILSLSYISYYSASATAQRSVPYDFILFNDQGQSFTERLHEEKIEYKQVDFSLLSAKHDMSELLENELPEGMMIDPKSTETIIMKHSEVHKVMPNFKLKEGEGYLVGYSGMLAEFMPFQVNKPVHIMTSSGEVTVQIKKLDEEPLISYRATYSSPALVVTDELFELLANDPVVQKQTVWTNQTGIDLVDRTKIKEVQSLYEETTNDGSFEFVNVEGHKEVVSLDSQESFRQSNLEVFGLVIFITGFLGLAFLMTTGSILYFKQMTEAEEERASYTILRKIGFSKKDLMKGIYMKQLFNFGVPLVIGLAHSYFAVKSGWMFFGTELVAPLLITMSIYVVLYSAFAFLSIGYYKRVVNESL
ncbi:FtsX-like permease family protein [Psychrobacillus vulpis]|uniref:FtsX-like permease family protein n=1 Tax=Psychrobacillus vulpis TaxID=2325572 RepID=A0A544TNA7_9BACI|nr:ABC transporter permease [Psychrobacillus vulpis]TQR18937.1 FtsX-like permease family protein [Psychrobacillus vulpis]